MPDEATFRLDGEPVPLEPGDTVMTAARRAGRDIPHLCWADGLPPHGSCRVCVVTVDGRTAAACTTRVAAGQSVECRTPALDAKRRLLLQMLLVDGHHFCPGCEKSGGCGLQSAAYAAGVQGLGFETLADPVAVDASHPDVFLDRGRCIRCGLCVRASREHDGKDVFALGDHGLHTVLLVNAPSGRLGDTDLSVHDAAVAICPTGALMPKRRGFVRPIGARPADLDPVTGSAT